jgi:hypothetical protein
MAKFHPETGERLDPEVAPVDTKAPADKAGKDDSKQGEKPSKDKAPADKAG